MLIGVEGTCTIKLVEVKDENCIEQW